MIWKLWNELGCMEEWMYKGINEYGNYEMNWDIWKDECMKGMKE